MTCSASCKSSRPAQIYLGCIGSRLIAIAAHVDLLYDIRYLLLFQLQPDFLQCNSKKFTQNMAVWALQIQNDGRPSSEATAGHRCVLRRTGDIDKELLERYLTVRAPCCMIPAENRGSVIATSEQAKLSARPTDSEQTCTVSVQASHPCQSSS